METIVTSMGFNVFRSTLFKFINTIILRLKEPNNFTNSIGSFKFINDQRKAVKNYICTSIFLLISFLGHSQDLQFIKALNSLSNDTAKEFADQIIVDSETKFEFLRFDETINQPENFYEVIYIPVDAVDKEKKVKPFVKCDDCIKVRFYIYKAGENRDLEIEGTRALRFHEVNGRYLDLFPVWQKIFKPNANLKETLDDFKSQELKIKDPKIDYRFYKRDNENNWYIHNYS